MKTERIKVTDLHSLHLEKQRLQMQIDYTEEQIVDRVSGFIYEFPVRLVTGILPFGLGDKPGVIKGVRGVRSFVGGFLGGEGSAQKRALLKIVFPLAKTFIGGALSKLAKRKKTEN